MWGFNTPGEYHDYSPFCDVEKHFKVSSSGFKLTETKACERLQFSEEFCDIS